MENVMIVQSGEQLRRTIDGYNVRLMELSILHERAKAQNTIMKGMLAKFLDEFEAAWDNDEQCTSPEIAQDYIDAAVFMRNHGRINNRIRDVDHWVKNFLPFN